MPAFSFRTQQQPVSRVDFGHYFTFSRLVNSRNPDKKLRSDANFWSSLAPEVIADLYEVYRIDFELFGYSLAEYFRPIGLEAKAAEVERILSKGGRRGEEL